MRAPGPARLTVLVAAGAALACVAAGLARPPAPTPPTGSVEAVQAVSLVCPRPVADGATSTALGLVSPPEVEAAAVVPDGRATWTDLAVGSEPRPGLQAVGTAAVVTVPAATTTMPVVADGEGALAPGLAAGQVSRTVKGRGLGLRATGCAAPAAEAWFVGGGGAVGRRTTLWLTNPDSTPAVVDVELFGPDGPVTVRGGTGVLVPPRKQKALRLDVLAPGTTRTAVHVIARAGRVSSAMEDVNTRGLIPLGADFVPQAAPPTATLVVPGILGGTSGKRLLQVLAPGDADAIVDLTIVTEDGTFAPDTAAVLEIPAGAVGQVDLAPFLDGTASAAVVLASDVPVVAGVRTIQPASSGRSESAYTAATPALAGPAAFGPVSVDDARRPKVLLTAAGAEATVTVTLLDPSGGEPSQRLVVVAAGTTLAVALTGTWSGAGLVVTPEGGSGPVQAALLLEDTGSYGVLVSTVPLLAGPLTVAVPPVQPDPATGVPED